MTPTPLTLVLFGWLIMAVIMLVLWVFQRAHRDAGIVDVGWAAGLGILAIFYAALADGDLTRRIAVGGLVALWSFRLAIYLLINRVIGKPEDGRYQALRENWKDKVQPFFFFFFQAQGLLDVILSLCFLLPMFNKTAGLQPLEYAGVAIWLISVIGESLADAQLAAFRADPATKGQTCRRGRWQYSRHPNYFFEWLHWWTYVAFSITLPFGWLSLIGPALMLFLILKVTGIPPTEERALRSRGDDYREYQRNVSAFFPWFPRRRTQ